MGIFNEMHDARAFSSPREYTELCRMLGEAIERGHVEQIPVLKPSRFIPRRKWYREKETGEIYELIEPEERGGGAWRRIGPEDLIDPNETVQ